MKTADAKRILQEWVESQVNVPVIFADQNGRAPDGAFFTLKILSTVDGNATELPPDDDDLVSIYSARTFSVSLQGYGAGVIDLAETVRVQFGRDTVLREFRRQGLPFVRADEVMNLTTDIDKRMEERAGLDMEFRAAAVVVDDPGIITGFTVVGDTGNYQVVISSDPTEYPVIEIDYTFSSLTVTMDSTSVTMDRT